MTSLSDDWRRWIAENKLLGISDEQIVAVLAGSGIDASAAA